MYIETLQRSYDSMRSAELTPVNTHVQSTPSQHNTKPCTNIQIQWKWVTCWVSLAVVSPHYYYLFACVFMRSVQRSAVSKVSDSIQLCRISIILICVALLCVELFFVGVLPIVIFVVHILFSFDSVMRFTWIVYLSLVVVVFCCCCCTRQVLCICE